MHACACANEECAWKVWLLDHADAVHRRRRDYDRGDRGDYRDGDRDGRDGRGYGNGGYGRKLKQGGVVANIVCDATGGCNDGRGNHYYDQNRDERCFPLAWSEHA